MGLIRLIFMYWGHYSMEYQVYSLEGLTLLQALLSGRGQKDLEKEVP